MTIQSFADAETQALFVTGKARRFANILPAATRKLTQLDAAPSLNFMKSPPVQYADDVAHDMVEAFIAG